MSWSSGSFGISVATYSPAYSYTRYYDSWSCGGWGYSGVYYGGWRNNWYGGFSYVYNPWPVYRTYYLYEEAPPPVLTRTEVVYVTPPATTTYVVQDAAAPVIQRPPAVATEPQQPQTAWEAPPAAGPAAEAAERCFCACQCNGQRPCTCEYPCGAEYAIEPDQFNLSLAYSSYAESLSPETIWSSYAGLDRWDSFTETTSYEAAVSLENDRR